VPAGAQRPRLAVPKRCCYTLAYRVCWRSPAAALLHSTCSAPILSVTNVYAASHLALVVLRAVAVLTPESLVWSRPIETHPSRRQGDSQHSWK
jgi:hypothetical protein